MKRAAIAALTAAAAAAAIVIAVIAVRPHPPTSRGAASRTAPADFAGSADLSPLRRFPLYRALIEAHAVRAVSTDRDGTIHLEADLRSALEPRFAALGLAGGSELFPASAQGAVLLDSAAHMRETWIFEGPAPLLDLLERNPGNAPGSPAMDSIPGAPSAVACFQLTPSRLADPALGGAALAPWRERIGFAEKLLGRSLRTEISEDLAGPGVFALYESASDDVPRAIVSFELKRSDRIASMLEMVFALGALTERGTVRRYRGVATGSFASSSGGPGLALAVDGPVVIIASTRERLESAIDARRAGLHRGGVPLPESDPAASWSAVSASDFVAHGWARLCRASGEPRAAGAVTTATLRAEGDSGWRLSGEGAEPAVTAEPMIPFLRSALSRRQRDPD